MQPVLTRSYNNARSGATYNETILTAAAVRRRGIVRQFSIPLPGDARGAEAQPLIIPNVQTSDGFKHDILLVATMANMLYAFDANHGMMLWAQRLGNPILGSAKIDDFGINTHWGIVSTPVVDPATNIVYSVVYSSPDGNYTTGEFTVHANRLVDGAPVRAPLSLENATHNPGNGIPTRVFSGAQRKQRASLLFSKIGGVTTLFIAAGSIFESAASNLGWLIAVDIETFTVSAALTTCPNHGGGGIWMSGQGPAADALGNIYFVTGNGTFNGASDFGECVCRATYTLGPPATLKIVDWFSPFADSMRDDGGDDTDAPTNSKSNDWDDQDLGSAGVVLIENHAVTISAGKDGIAYVNHMSNLGRTSEQQLIAGTQYAALAGPPIFFSYYPGPDVSPMPKDPSALNIKFANQTYEMHSTPVHYKLVLRDFVYCWGANGNLRAWSLSSTGVLSYLACSAETASPNALGGMPGGMITLSAHTADATSAVLWACVPYGDANAEVSPGRLLAYDATRFGKYADGSGSIEKIWDSQDWGIEFTFNKFNLPVVSGGRLFVPTYSGTIDVYGLT